MTDTGQIPGEGLPENAGMVAQPGIPAPDAYAYLDPSEHAPEDEDLLLMPAPQGAWSDAPAAPAPAPAPAPSGLPEQSAGQQSAFQSQHHAHVPAQGQPLYAAEAQTSTTGTHESGGRDSGSVDLNGVRIPAPAPVQAPAQVPVAAQAPAPARRPLHRGPASGDAPSYGGSPSGGVVRSLADRGPAGAPQSPMPARHAGPPTTGPEYFDIPADDQAPLPGPQLGEIPRQLGDPWGAQAPEQAFRPEPVPAVPAETVAPEQVAPEQVAPEPVAEATPEVPAEVQTGIAGLPDGVAEGTPLTTPLDAPAETAAAESMGQFVPVEGSVPTTPHLAPTPAAPAPDPVQPEAGAVTAEEARPDAVVDQEPFAVAPAAPVAFAPEVAPAAPVAFAPEVAPEPVAPTAPEPTAPAVAVAPVPVEAPEPEQAVEAPDGVAPVEPVTFAEPAPVAEPVAIAEPVGAPEPEPVAAPDPEPAALATPEPVVESEPELVAEPVPVPQAELPVEAEAEPGTGPEIIETPALETPAVGAPATELAGGAEPDAVTTDAEPRGAEAVSAEAAPAGAVFVEAAPDGTVVAEAAPAAAPEPAEPPAVTPPAPGYDDAEREAVLKVMRERRDIRNGFRSDPIPHEVLLRVLEAAHTAPSVGHSQPWDFVVIRSAETRRSMHELAQRQREAYAKSLPKGRAKQFKELKIEAILDTPVNIVVTADPTRGGRHTLGRHTQPQMAPYSSALAVENLWLAARAEGLGVGWVSFFDEREMVRALGLPDHLEVVAYLCVGYVDEFPEEPELMQAGWSKRRPLSWVVHEETYGRRALPGEEPHDLLQDTIASIRPLDAKALGEAWERQKRMTKPAGALGMLEIISAQLSGLSRVCPPPVPEPAAVAIFAGDHGVHAQGVTAWPQEVTGQMVANFLGGGAVCNAFAAQVGAEVCVVDVGVASDLPSTPGLLPRKVRPGTADFTTGPALTREEVLAAIEVGIETARDLVAAGNKGLLTGEMGIANTTASAALICVYTGMDPAEVTGRGTGINDEMHARKVDVVRRGLELHQPDPADPIGVLAAVGGLEHAAMAGFLLGGASLRTPVILDGVSAGAAALVARAIAPEALAACIAGHRSAEPGHVAALNKLGLRPLVDLDLRLGEGTGALLALPIVQSAARAMHDVATFDSAGVTEK
ncbi:nicotinate-nucleotide--dimethylbenzimidazole phosphoribosyltransferase [Streptomyces sp. NBC_00887]|uniref:nicotinate-nucleotide--dimethylbenzimidazole phosphoribosyltransferase n=1 Tax=Streptomyces sp. NBC_00887 TaxID=2975859 RepID=UPI0038709E2F|nr:nicotinate-nucleotide--dimethylbenzimidazole phosphoribosyltransferase [Streptomyces sp. NBC_00887]WSY35296.1 nicotinate-nucleotide--dimethylbenzimidazole phosphoribosyltransferase [Streptomyces sp. NBC_00887]